MCDSEDHKWGFEKFLEETSDAECVSENTAAKCTITAKKDGINVTIKCSDAPSANCPNDLTALINAWIKLRRRLQK